MLRIILKKSALVLLLIVLFVPIFLLPLSFFKNPDIKVWHSPAGFTLSGIEKYSDSCTFAAKYKTDIYAVNAGFLDAVGFELIIGRDFDSGIMSRGDCVIAVSKSYALEEFLSTDILGHTVEINKVQYKISTVFDDETNSFGDIAGIDFSNTFFMPYTSVSNYADLAVTTVVCTGEVPEELSLRLMKAKCSDIGYYKRQLRVTQYILLLVLAGMSTVINLIKFRKSKWRWIFLILFFIIIMLLICAVGNLPSDAVPQKGNVFETEYHSEAFKGIVESLLSGDIRTTPKLFYLYKIAITIYSVVILTGITLINQKLTS
ncbi:MAG: ABC transporter permease [Clostridia bacterium]|nr:ABC transporter permease [Clostridia bacterium]